MQGVTLKNTKGTLEIDGINAKADVTSELGSSKLSAKAAVNNNRDSGLFKRGIFLQNFYNKTIKRKPDKMIGNYEGGNYHA